jgi:hypothetical protein
LLWAVVYEGESPHVTSDRHNMDCRIQIDAADCREQLNVVNMAGTVVVKMIMIKEMIGCA